MAAKKDNVRASAILTTSDVLTSAFSCGKARGGFVNIIIDFTKGSLTSADFTFYVSDNSDGSSPVELFDLAGNTTYNQTASIKAMYTAFVAGYLYLFVAVKGTGTLTSSLAKVDIGYDRAPGVV